MGMPVTQANSYGGRDSYAPSEANALRRMLATPRFTPASAPTDVCAIISTGYATVLRVDKIVVSGIADTAAVIDVLVQSAAHNNTGTSTATTTAAALGLNPVGALAFPLVSSNAQALYYTANKSSNGNGVSGSRPALAYRQMKFGTTSEVCTPAVFEWPRGHGPEIRDLVTSVVVNLAGQTMPANAQLRIDEIHVTETRAPRISFCGDSLFAAAGEVYWTLAESGGLLQVAPLDNLSTSGVTIDNYINNTGGIFFSQSSVVPARSQDVVVFGYGINDVRTGMTQATLTARLETCIQAIYAGGPKAKIVLCSPNYPAADDPTAGGFIPLTGQFSGLTLAQAAQLCGDICRAAYESFRGDPRIYALFHRSDYLGSTVATVANSGTAIGQPAAVMTDQLHPNAAGRRLWALPFRGVLRSAVAARMAEING